MTLIHPRTRAFFGYFARAYPAGTIVMVAMLMVSGLLEGISVITLVPVLEIAMAPGDGAAGGGSGIGEVVRNGLLAVGIEPTLTALVGLVVVGITLKAIFLWLAMRQVGYTVARVTLDLRLQLVRALLKARWSYFGKQPIGNFANSISREAVRSSMAYREACTVLGGIFQVVIYLVVSALISWQVTVVALVTGTLLIRSLRVFVAMGRSAGEQSMTLTRDLTARLVDAVQGIKPMKAMAREELFWPLLEGQAKELNRADRRTVIASESIRLFQEPIATLVLGIGLVFMLTVGNHSFSAVVVLAFIFYRLMSHANTLQMQYGHMANGEAMFWSLREQIDAASREEERHPGRRPPEGLNDAIELRNVSFSYGDLRVLEEMTVRIPARQLTALIGQSGSGKTTILDLITGLHRPAAGDVYIDGVPLGEVDLAAWRAMIGYVPQDTFLFHDTVRRNITLGDDAIPDERVVQALRDAGAWEFIDRDAEGIHATISPQGSNLSGGQRQRLAIARALVRDPALIVLDEATTGLDTRTEAEILETLRRLREKVTVLAISHQPALRAVADVTVELEDGRVSEMDTMVSSSFGEDLGAGAAKVVSSRA